MEQHLDAFHRRTQLVRPFEHRLDQLDRAELPQRRGLAGVVQGTHAGAYLVAALQQRLDQVVAEMPVAAGDECAHGGLQGVKGVTIL
jgi:hypothetical protein